MLPSDPAPDPSAQPTSGQPSPDRPASAASGFLFQLPDWFRALPLDTPLTPELQERLRESLRPVADQGMQHHAQGHDRQAVLERLPEVYRERLWNRGSFTDEELAALREYFQGDHPELARRIDPVDVVQHWRFLTWYARAHGHPEPILPARVEPAADVPPGDPPAESAQGDCE